MNITVTAQRWSGGWELVIDDDHVTQVRTLDKAAQQVLDYLDTDDPQTDHSDWVVHIVPSIDEWDAVVAAREATAEATRAQEKAAAMARAVTHRLRASGLSVTDCAHIMGVSRGRISQLTATPSSLVATTDTSED